MKRRNADCGKLRRPIKRNKITEGMYGSSTVLYMKFLLLWAIVITADFMFMFRFEFLWPFWLLLRSVHDSFKYKGLAFSVLFVCIAITSDLVCLFFIPVHWLLFAASTYVWVQYVWHTDKGICLPTIILWMLFVYLEAGIRWKDTRHMPHLDLCRPFAAHCIGYPVVTLGFGFKSYVGYRMRQRKQREVAKENEFYMQLLQQALPQEEVPEEPLPAVANSASNAVTAVGNGGVISASAQSAQSSSHASASNTSASALTTSNGVVTVNAVTSNGHIGGKNHRRSVDKENNKYKGSSSNATDESKHNKNSNNYQQHDSNSNHNNNNNNNSSKDKTDWESNNYQVHQTPSQNVREKNDDHRTVLNTNSSKRSNSHSASGAAPTTNGSVLQYDVDDVIVELVERTKGRRNRSKKDNASKDNHHPQHHQNANNNNNTNSHSNNNSNTNNSNSTNSNHLHNHHQQKDKDTSQNMNNNSDASSVSSSASSSSSSSTSSVATSTSSTISNLASKVVSKICESCLKLEADVKKYRSELSHMKQIENELRQKLESNLTTKSCLQAKQKECEDLEKRLHDLTNARHADMMQMQAVERRLTEERRQKQSLEAQLNNEKKARKIAEEKAARPECSNQCKQRKQQMDEEIMQLRCDLQIAEEGRQLAEQHGRQCEQEVRRFEVEIRNRDSNSQGSEMLINAVAALQDKNYTLEKNLSAETRVKLDLFSALGDAKRQLEISESRRRSKEEEVLDLKAKIAQLLAVMPTDSLLPACNSAGASSMLRMNDTPPLQTGPGPASPMLSSLNAQQSNVSNCHQLNARVNSNSAGDYVPQSPTEYGGNTQQQQQCGGVVPVSVAASVLVQGSSAGGGAGNSSLDPNATIYTPKGPGASGGVVVVGGAGDA